MNPVFADYHTHTIYSHGKGTPEENVLAAIKCGLSKIAISEHASSHMLYGVRGGRLLALRREIDDLNRRFANDIEVLMGLECNVTRFGQSDAPKDASMFDILILGYHRCVFPRDAYMQRALFEAYRLVKPDPVRSAEGMLAAAEKHPFNIFAHPGEYIQVDMKTLAQGAKELGISLELNARHMSMTDNDILTAAGCGARFMIGSDAHAPIEIGRYENALITAGRLGIMHLIDNVRTTG